MFKRHVFLATLVTLMLVAGLGACRGVRHPGGFDEFDLEAVGNRIASRLELSESQKTELKAIITELAAKARELHADRQVQHRELADLVRQEAISRETADRIIADKFARMRQLADLAADRLITFHGALTPEQRDKIAVHIEERAEGSHCFFRR